MGFPTASWIGSSTQGHWSRCTVTPTRRPGTGPAHTHARGAKPTRALERTGRSPHVGQSKPHSPYIRWLARGSREHHRGRPHSGAAVRNGDINLRMGGPACVWGGGGEVTGRRGETMCSRLAKRRMRCWPGPRTVYTTSPTSGWKATGTDGEGLGRKRFMVTVAGSTNAAQDSCQRGKQPAAVSGKKVSVVQQRLTDSVSPTCDEYVMFTPPSPPLGYGVTRARGGYVATGPLTQMGSPFTSTPCTPPHHNREVRVRGQQPAA